MLLARIRNAGIVVRTLRSALASSRTFFERKSVGLIRATSEVNESLDAKMPVVALESTIITHGGMPYPQNFNTARNVEAIVRRNGAVPATIAVMDGTVHVGMSEEQLDELARYNGSMKISKRDLPVTLSKGYIGGTTVSATAEIAHKVGINVFVTGGIGGVHRGAHESMDISSDLTELSRTPIAVVSAGVKSILDIEKTLEYLETQGVCVVTYGNSTDFPAFFTAKSGFKSPHNVQTPTAAADIIAKWKAFGGNSAILIAVPIPDDQAADGVAIEAAIVQANDEAKNSQITGKEVTPFILRKVNELTSGKSLKTKNNAHIGSQIAVCLSEKRAESRDHSTTERRYRMPTSDTKAPVVIGGSNADISVKITQDQVQRNGSTNLGKIWLSIGGVGRNVADVLSRLDHDPVFVTAIGRDAFGDNVLAAAPRLSTKGVLRVEDTPTATYVAVLGKPGDVYIGVGDMDIHRHISRHHVAMHSEHIRAAPILVVDGNTPRETLEFVLDFCGQAGVPVWFEPTDSHRANKPFQSDAWHHISYMSPNMNELRHIYATITGDEEVLSREDCSAPLEELLEECLKLCTPIVKHVPCVIITLDRNGVFVVRNCEGSQPFHLSNRRTNAKILSAIHYESPKVEIRNVSGAGDCLAGAMTAGIIRGHSAEDCVLRGLHAAGLSLQSQAAVPDTLTTDNVFGNVPTFALLAQYKPRTII